MPKAQRLFVLWLSQLLFAFLLSALVPSVGHGEDVLGFLVLAPDRGYWGNEEVRELFQAYQASYPLSELAFVTKRQAARHLKQGLRRLKDRGASRVVAIPLFLSSGEEKLQRAQALLGLGDGTTQDPSGATIPLDMAPPLGESVLASEILRDRLATLSQPGGHERLVLLGYGAVDAKQEARIQETLRTVYRRLEGEFPFQEVQTAVLYDHWAPQDRRERAMEHALALIKGTAGRAGRTVAVPLFLAWKATPMMSAWHRVERGIKDYDVVHDGRDLFHKLLVTWLKKTSNRYLPLRREEVGVVILSHGADLVWNDEIRRTFRPLEEKYLIEYDFSMAHPETLAKAINRLEKRGARAIVILLTFAMEASFKERTELIVGLADPLDHRAHASHATPPPIRSGARFVVTGGLEDSPLFAEALLQRAQEISETPEKETVTLVAHGSGDDEKDRHWNRVLASLVTQMKSLGGDKFRALRWATWREDWPEKREVAIQRIREMVEEAGRDGGRALVIDARINGPGPAERFLKGLEFTYNGEGFAPHPNLLRWAEAQIEKAIAPLQAAHP